jgi:cytochrome c peroxidase
MRRKLFLTCLVLAAFAPALLAQGPPPPLGPPPVPPGNPLTPAKTNLGKTLFWDEQLSSNGTVACGTCHVLVHGGSDPRTSATNAASRNPGPDGVFNTPDDVLGSQGTSRIQADGRYVLDALFRLHRQVTPRKAPSVLNAAYAPLLFWDGRASGTFRDPLTNTIVLTNGAALESQSVGPPVSDVEMGHIGRDWNDAAAKIAAATPLRVSPSVPAALANWIAGRDYPALFQEAFGTPDVTPSRIAMAIATYERALFTNQAPIDQAPPQLTPQEQQGQQIFNGVGRCNVCHGGPRFTNDSFRYTGVRPQNDDLGRFVVTGDPIDRGRMKVPTLRNVELRAPFFRNGEMVTLEDVVDFYDRGGDFNAPNKDPNIHPLGLNATQKAALAAFMRRPLTDPRVTQGAPPFDRPVLYSESSRVPSHYGAASTGTGGFAPQMIADEPLVVGNPRFTLAVDRGNAGTHAILVISPDADLQGTPFQGANFYVTMGPGTTLVRIGALSGAGAGQGFGSATIAIPADPSLVGRSFHAQWFALDSTPGRRLSASEAVYAVYF